jgi:hypothetical protein
MLFGVAVMVDVTRALQAHSVRRERSALLRLLRLLRLGGGGMTRGGRLTRVCAAYGTNHGSEIGAISRNFIFLRPKPKSLVTITGLTRLAKA